MPLQPVCHYVPQQILDETRAFLYQRGLEGCEGAALWIGHPISQGVQIIRLLVPEQDCIKTAYGVAVDLTEKAHFTLTDHLGPGERFYVRIHSHPGEAYHSPRDDQNPVLTHQGALSIVVPNFARSPIEFASCAIYRLEHGRGWLHLSQAEIASLFQVTP